MGKDYFKAFQFNLHQMAAKNILIFFNESYNALHINFLTFGPQGQYKITPGAASLSV